MRKNAGFMIVGSIPVTKDLEVVIGFKTTSLGDQYVCWYCKNQNDYFWGRYTKTYDDVIRVLMERIETYYPMEKYEENSNAATVD